MIFSQGSFPFITPFEPVNTVLFRQGKLYDPCFANKKRDSEK